MPSGASLRRCHTRLCPASACRSPCTGVLSSRPPGIRYGGDNTVLTSACVFRVLTSDLQRGCVTSPSGNTDLSPLGCKSLRHCHQHALIDLSRPAARRATPRQSATEPSPSGSCCAVYRHKPSRSFIRRSGETPPPSVGYDRGSRCALSAAYADHLPGNCTCLLALTEPHQIRVFAVLVSACCCCGTVTSCTDFPPSVVTLISTVPSACDNDRRRHHCALPSRTAVCRKYRSSCAQHVRRSVSARRNHLLKRSAPSRTSAISRRCSSHAAVRWQW